MKKFFLTTLTLWIGFTSFSHATDLEIVDVKRNISLSETDPVYKDYYIRVSSKSDLKKNQVVKATRKVSVKDFSLKPVGDFVTDVGLIKIIHTSDTIAVGREFKLTPRDDEPMLEQIGIMVGDTIDTSNSFIDTTKRKPAVATNPDNTLAAPAPAQPPLKAEIAPAAQDI